jgi:hypothetical protein
MSLYRTTGPHSHSIIVNTPQIQRNTTLAHANNINGKCNLLTKFLLQNCRTSLTGLMRDALQKILELGFGIWEMELPCRYVMSYHASH